MVASREAKTEGQGLDLTGWLLSWEWWQYALVGGLLVLGGLGWLGARAIGYWLSHVKVMGRVEGKMVVVSPQASGRLALLRVESGQRVRQGQEVGRLDSEDLKARVREAEATLLAAESQVAQARANLELARAQTLSAIRQAQAELASARAEATAATEAVELQARTGASEMARAGAGLKAAAARLQKARAGPRAQEVEAARAALRAAQARAKQTQQNLETWQRLHEKGYASARELQAAEAAYEVARAEQEAANQQLSLVQAGLRAEDIEATRQEMAMAEAMLREAEASQVRTRMSQVEAARKRAEVARALAALSAAQAGQKEVALRHQEVLGTQAQADKARAVLEAAKVELAETVVRAPVDGFVVDTKASAGEVVGAGQPILFVIEAERLWITANLAETEVRRVKPGQQVTLKFEAYPKVRRQGRLRRIGRSTFSQAPRTADSEKEAAGALGEQVPVSISFDPAGLNLLPGMTAEVAIKVR